MNQETIVLNALKRSPNGITQRDMIPFGVFRLAARVFDLTNKGHPIHTEIESFFNRQGNKSRCARYFLRGDM